MTTKVSLINFVERAKSSLSQRTYSILMLYIHCVSKNDNDVLRYNFNAHQPILIIFGRDITE